MTQIKDEINCHETKIIIAMPDKVEVKLVSANELRHYEISFGLVSLFSSASVGFWTAYLTTGANKILFWVSIVFSLFTAVFMLIGLYYRLKLKGDGIKKVAPFNIFK